MDDFKHINDTYGHTVGDQFLIEIASRLKFSLREFDSVTRMGGDEFILLIPEIQSSEQVEALVGRILERVKSPFILSGATFSPACSIGIALYPEQGETPEALIANSDRALYLAKKLGKNSYAFAGDKR